MSLIWIFCGEVAKVCNKVWQRLFSFTNTERQIVKKFYQTQKHIYWDIILYADIIFS